LSREIRIIECEQESTPKKFRAFVPGISFVVILGAIKKALCRNRRPLTIACHMKKRSNADVKNTVFTVSV
jgi:hypothetical protein